MLLVTIAVVALLFAISYFVFDRDLLAPPTAVALVFLFGCFCAFYNEKRWGLDFSAQSAEVIAAGIMATMIGGAIGVYLTSYKNGRFSFSFSHDITEPKEITVNSYKTFIIIAFQIAAMVLIFTHIRRLTGYTDWIAAVSRYRQLTGKNRDLNNLALRMPFLTKNMGQASKMMAIVYAYIAGNNLIASQKKLSLNWIPVILYSITTFMQGDRSGMIRLWLEIMIVAYTIHRRRVGWRSSKETRKVIRGMAVSVVLLALVFSAVREIVGRIASSDPLYYVTFYAGSPTAVLDQMVTDKLFMPSVWGQRTFYYLNQSLTALIGWPGSYNFYYDFYYSPNGSVIGNAPTAFAPAYKEFGFWGFFFIMAAFGVFFMVLYCKTRNKSSENPIDFRLLMYSYIAYVFLMYFYSTFFDFLSHVYIKYMIELLLIRWFLVGWKFKSRMKITFGKKERLISEDRLVNSKEGT